MRERERDTAGTLRQIRDDKRKEGNNGSIRCSDVEDETDEVRFCAENTCHCEILFTASNVTARNNGCGGIPWQDRVVLCGTEEAKARDGEGQRWTRQRSTDAWHTGDTVDPRILRGVQDDTIQKWSGTKGTPREPLFHWKRHRDRHVLEELCR